MVVVGRVDPRCSATAGYDRWLWLPPLINGGWLATSSVIFRFTCPRIAELKAIKVAKIIQEQAGDIEHIISIDSPLSASLLATSIILYIISQAGYHFSYTRHQPVHQTPSLAPRQLPHYPAILHLQHSQESQPHLTISREVR